jgi:hypothetical protein
VEGFLTAAFKAAGHEIKTPFPRMEDKNAERHAAAADSHPQGRRDFPETERRTLGTYGAYHHVQGPAFRAVDD